MTELPKMTLHITAPGEEPCTRAELAAGVSEIRQLVGSAFEVLRLMGERLDAQSRWMVAHSGRHDVADLQLRDLRAEVGQLHGLIETRYSQLHDEIKTLDAGQVVIGEALDEVLDELETRRGGIELLDTEEEAEESPAGDDAIGALHDGVDYGVLRIFVDGRPVLPVPCSLCQRAGGEGCTYCRFYRD